MLAPYGGCGSCYSPRRRRCSVCCICCLRTFGPRRTVRWGFWGWMLSLFGHVLAAAVCFGISRALGRVPVEVLVGKTGLESADRWFARWGVYAVFAGRLLPGVAFDAISYAAGLTRMRFRSFIAATALGIFPQTFLY